MAFEPENILEASLVKATTEPEHRAQFYRDFVESTLLLVHVPENPEEGGAAPPEDRQTIRLGIIEADNGKQYIPAFSSLTRIQAFVQNEVAYVGINALEFLKMIGEQNVILNPGSDYGKEFLPEEIAAIVDGSIWRPVTSATYNLGKPTGSPDRPAGSPDKPAEVIVGEPKTYPTALAEALSNYFKTRKGVKSAYLAHYFNPATDQQPHTLVAIEMTGEWDDVTAGINEAIGSTPIPDPPVDFMKLSGNGGIEEYFNGKKPFYQKKRFGIF